MIEVKYKNDLLTDEQMAAHHGMSVEAYRTIVQPFAAMGVSRALKAARAAPTADLRKLAAAPIGASHLFPQYTKAAQMSALISSVKDETGARFSSRREHSLVDGKFAGVRVTRIS